MQTGSALKASGQELGADPHKYSSHVIIILLHYSTR